MEETLPLNATHVNNSFIFTNRLHILLHSIALCFLLYYRFSFLFHNSQTPLLLPYLLLFSSEIILSFLWILDQSFRWHPITRTVFPERLPENDQLPHIDVFICTADPTKEPTLDVVNTVLSAMALDYPPQKLHVYLSDDGGSNITLNAMKEGLKFAKWWIPFCVRYRVLCRCPEAYFNDSENDSADFCGDVDFFAYKRMIKVDSKSLFNSMMSIFRKNTCFIYDVNFSFRKNMRLLKKV